MTNLQQVIQKLKSQGKTEEEITLAVESLSRLAVIRYTTTLLNLLDSASNSAEADTIEKIADEAERQKKMEEFYQQKTGQSPDQLANAKLEEAAAEFLKQHN